jgi:hypothetical protein
MIHPIDIIINLKLDVSQYSDTMPISAQRLKQQCFLSELGSGCRGEVGDPGGVVLTGLEFMKGLLKERVFKTCRG